MTIAKVQKGKKRVCENCSTRWYDLNKKPVICPVCNQELEINDLNLLNTISYQNLKKVKKNTDEVIDEIDKTEDREDVDIDNENDIISLEEVEDQKN